MLQSIESQRVRHDWVTEQQVELNNCMFWESLILVSLCPECAHPFRWSLTSAHCMKSSTFLIKNFLFILSSCLLYPPLALDCYYFIYLFAFCFPFVLGGGSAFFWTKPFSKGLFFSLAAFVAIVYSSTPLSHLLPLTLAQDLLPFPPTRYQNFIVFTVTF